MTNETAYEMFSSCGMYKHTEFMTQLRAGIATVDITPPVGIAHGNWGAQTHERAAGVDLSLRTTVLALGGDSDSIVIADIDIGNLTYKDAKRTREEISRLVDIPTSNVRLSFSHTHSGPTTRRESWIDEGSEMVEPYLESLPHLIAGAAWEAVESMEPARVAAGTGHSEIAINRRFQRPEDGRMIVGRNPDGPVDYEVGVLRFDTVAGEPLAAVANYACHPITVGPDNDLITPDYPGVVRQTVEESTGATCLFLQGAAGDVGPIHGVAKNGIDEYRPLGRRLGSEVARVWWSLDPRGREERYVETLESGAPLAVYEYDENVPNRSIIVLSREIELPIRDLMSFNEAKDRYEDHRKHLQQLRKEDADNESITNATFRAKRAKQDEKIAGQFGGKETHPIEVQIIVLSPNVAVVGIPGEPFVETGKAIKQKSPFEYTLFSGYSNVSRVAYIPTAKAHEEGGYETRVTPFAPEAADKIVDEVVADLETLQN
ncbi:neutral/alkaline non-lysosomal ceramidase N-terminal domain-containing protein [Halorubrum trueperi]|uniref:Neutral/alkaline non-lysosomal ceramidase N-terminal domain-containing protein n=1 Tax=Halorubrum trueperi TaxID=2004704 RepID=A0ABD5UL55_9EURY